MKEVLFLQEINMAPKAIPACIPLAYDAIARLNGKLAEADKALKKSSQTIPVASSSHKSSRISSILPFPT